MQPLHRCVVIGLFTALALVVILGASAPLESATPECTCTAGRGCYHYLNAPVAAPDDPCVCPRCRADRGSCPQDYPEDWNARCAKSRKLPCFLRRHAVSWGLTCSEMLSDSCGCRGAEPKWCPSCGKGGHDPFDPELTKMIAGQIEVEQQVFGAGAEIVIVESPHFYVVTDIDRLEIRTEKGRKRKLSMHEVAHLYAQRAEVAFADFSECFGHADRRNARVAIYLTRQKITARRIAGKYFGRTDLDYQFANRIGTPPIGRRTYDGISISLEKHPGDHALESRMRHNLGHVLMSSWVRAAKPSSAWPPWVLLGPGHWLSRRPEKLADRATFHVGEGKLEKDAGQDWLAKLRLMAADPGLAPMQTLLDERAFEVLTVADHRRIWSWFEFFLAEDRENFVQFVAAVSGGQDVREACREAFGCTPEDLDQRWRDRVIGKRPSIAATEGKPDGAEDAPAPGARQIDAKALRDMLLREKDPRIVAAAIAAMDKIGDPKVAALLIDALPGADILVRETTISALAKRCTPEMVAWLSQSGLKQSRGFARGFVARILRQIGDPRAGPALLSYTKDPNWFAQAEAARALGVIAHAPAIPRLTAMVGHSKPLVAIAALDAISRFGPGASAAADAVGKLLTAEAWQLRSAAAACLGTLGAPASVDLLIERLGAESGRLTLDVRAALAQLTGTDLGGDPKAWRDWWKQRQADGEGLDPAGERRNPPRVLPGVPRPDRPTWFGLEVTSGRAGFVIDVSESMTGPISIERDWLKLHHRGFGKRDTKFDLGMHETATMLRALQPADVFRLYYFANRASATSAGLVAATPPEIEQALALLNANRPRPDDPYREHGRTNFADLFRLVLSLKKSNSLKSDLQPTPDTICFLSDGYPTAGEVTDPDTLLTWFGEANFYARIRVHSVAFGGTETDWGILRRLATENGGQFMLIPESR